MSAKSRNIYLVMGHNITHRNTYVSKVFSTKKKAGEYMSEISDIMSKHDPEVQRTYWIHKEKVS